MRTGVSTLENFYNKQHIYNAKMFVMGLSSKWCSLTYYWTMGNRFLNSEGFKWNLSEFLWSKRYQAVYHNRNKYCTQFISNKAPMYILGFWTRKYDIIIMLWYKIHSLAVTMVLFNQMARLFKQNTQNIMSVIK